MNENYVKLKPNIFSVRNGKFALKAGSMFLSEEFQY